MREHELHQLAAVVCFEVANGQLPILYAERSEPDDEGDSGWQFLCGAPLEDWRAAQVWAIHEVLEREPTLASFIGLPSGTVLFRKSRADNWHVKDAGE